MPVEMLLAPVVESDSDFEFHMEGACPQTHQRKKDGSICNGPCDLGFSHYPADHHCGTCGENF